MPVGVTPFLGFCEPVASLMHLIASVLVLVASPRLVRLGGSRRRGLSLTAFIVAASLLLALSGIYHSFEPGPARDLAQRFDHAAIWTLIVGTFTPIAVVILRGNMRRVTMVIIWSIAVAGVVLKTVFWHEIPEWVGLVFYIGLGWFGALSCWGLVRHSGWTSVALCLGGGVSYTTGAVLEYARTPIIIPDVLGPHEVFHLAIVIGVGLHWILLDRLMRVPRVPPAQQTWWDMGPTRFARPFEG